MLHVTYETTDSIKVTTSSANALEVVIDYSVRNGSAYPGKNAVASISAAATTTLLATPSEAESCFDIERMTFSSKGGANTITVLRRVSGTDYQETSVSLSSGDALEYEDGTGYTTKDSSGQEKLTMPGYLPLAGGTLTGDLLFTDASFDIGKTGATRPRDLFLSRNATIGGTTTLAGALIGAATQSVFNTVSTTVNAFGAASTAINIGNASGAWTLSGSGFGFGTAPTAGNYFRLQHDWGQAGTETRGQTTVTTASENVAPTGNVAYGEIVDVRVGGSADAVTNTQNWTNDPGLVGFSAILRMRAGMSGTITAAASFLASDTIVSAGTLTKQYGFYCPALTSAGTNYSIYTNAGLVRLGDNTTITGTLNIGTIGAFAASDKYLIVDSSGNVHKSATGPGS